MIKRLSIFFFLNALFLGPHSFGQVCQGSIGENIFVRGDFGFGLANVVQQNPQIAPGYSYTTSPPPQDGQYTLSNNTEAWSGLFPTWLEIRDNSNDPNGYMMVVNASFSPGIFYEEVVDGLCPNTLYVFSADIINLIAQDVQGHILPNVQFLLDNSVQYSTGDIAQSERWNTFGFTFMTTDDQTMVRLTLRNNAPGGIGNDLALDNITFRPCGPQSFIGIESDTTIFLCEEGEPFAINADITSDGQAFSIQWQESLDEGVSWQNSGTINEDRYIHNRFQPGTYSYRYLSATSDENLINTKCRVISDVVTITVLPKENNLQDSFCVNSSYFFGDNLLTEPGNYIDTFQSSLNCDSIVYLDLIEVDDPGIQASLIVSDPSCYQAQNGMLEVINIENGYAPYSILMNGNESSTLLNNLGPGNYGIEIIDRLGCKVQFERMLVDPPEFFIEPIMDQDLLLGEFFQINIAGNSIIDSIIWIQGTGLSCTSCLNPTITPVDNGIFILKAIDVNGCEATVAFEVKVERQEIFYLPTIFSPNEDGVNDVFFISSYQSSVKNIEDFFVFDRWGNVVFENHNFVSNDRSIGWSPNSKNSLGVYTYLVVATLIDDTLVTIKGNVTLIE